MATIYNVVHVTDREYKRTLGLPLEVGTHDRKNVEIDVLCFSNPIRLKTTQK